jgi:hypothetical protein
MAAIPFHQMFLVVDLLLPAAALTFLLPLNPIISSVFATSWTMAQLLLAPDEKRWALWPMAFVLLVMARTWWLNEMPHPASGQDLLILVASFLAATAVGKRRWPLLLALPLGILPVLISQIGPKPWTPNPLVGANQGAYLLGLILIIAIGWLCQKSKTWWVTATASSSAVLALLLIWQTASRAALLSCFLAIGFVFLRERAKRKEKTLPAIVLLTTISLVGLGIKQLIRPSTTGIPGLNPSSDLGRLLIGKCYLSLPLTGSNRFLYGVGFERPKDFCHQLINNGVADHAHNLYLQLWANTGILGLLGLGFAIYLLVNKLRFTEDQLDPLLRRIGMAALVYTLLQGCFDISLLHWPVTQVFTGILLAIPFSKTSTTETDLVSQSN